MIVALKALLGSAAGSDGGAGVDFGAVGPAFELETPEPLLQAEKEVMVATAANNTQAFICIFKLLPQVSVNEHLFNFNLQAQDFRAAVAKPGHAFLYRIELQNVNSRLARRRDG